METRSAADSNYTSPTPSEAQKPEVIEMQSNGLTRTPTAPEHDLPNPHQSHPEEPAQAPIEVALDRQDTTPVIFAPDGLPRVQGRHWIPKPITFWVSVAIIVLDLFVMPIVYFYAFDYGAHLKLQDNFAVITGLFGLFCFLHYTYRGWKLLLSKKARKKCRPLAWTRMGIAEFLHVNIAIIIFLVEIELVVGTAFNDPVTRLVAMTPATINYYCGFLAIVTQTFHDLRWTLPFNQSSTPKGSVWRPALLVFIEDFGAIECSGERDYRASILARFDASPDFRRMIRKLSWFWGIGLIFSGAAATAIIMAIPDERVAFGIGWGFPPCCVAPLAIITNSWVKWETKRERAAWAEKHNNANGTPVEG